MSIDSYSADTTSIIQHLIAQIETVIRGKRAQIEHVITCLLAGGHILMEDNPGTGKTVLARTLAAAISGEDGADSVDFKRVQFTPDLLPMDLLGSHIFDEGKKDFTFRKGPLFCNVLLADEINRASPKVQSALLESMAENQITMGEITYKLDDLFFTIATQNPIEMEGTYPLPSAQLDRFFMKIYFGYVDEATELDIYQHYNDINRHLHQMQRVLSKSDVIRLKQEADEVAIHEELIKAVSNLVRGTRAHADITVGGSTRSGISFIKCLKAHALVKGRSFVIEDDVIELARPVLEHRLVYKNKEGRMHALNQLIQQENDRLIKLKLF